MKVLVIGGSGFVGSGLIPTLIAQQIEVTVLNRGNNVIYGTKQLVADRNSEQQMLKATQKVEEQFFDAIIDTSCYTLKQCQVAFYAFQSKTNYWIQLSSAAVYLESEVFPHEAFPIGGAKIWGQYGKDKAEIDEFLMKASITSVIVRPPYIYGPNNNHDRECFVWSRALAGKPIIIPNDQTSLIQFIHIEDLAKFFVQLVQEPEKESAIYNLAAQEQVTLQEWVIVTLKAAGLAAKLIINESTQYSARQYFPFRDYSCCLNTEKVRKKRGWQEEYSLEEGLRQTYQTYNPKTLKAGLVMLDAEEFLI